MEAPSSILQVSILHDVQLSCLIIKRIALEKVIIFLQQSIRLNAKARLTLASYYFSKSAKNCLVKLTYQLVIMRHQARFASRGIVFVNNTLASCFIKRFNRFHDISF